MDVRNRLKRMDDAVAMFLLGKSVRDVALHFGMRIDNLNRGLELRGLVEPVVRARKPSLARVDYNKPVKAKAIAIAQYREPCWRCGARADHGCAHQRQSA